MPKQSLVGIDARTQRVLHEGRNDIRRANYEALQHWYAALSRRESERATIAFHGDSLTAGGFATTKARTFTRIITDSIQRMFRIGGRGWMPCFTYLPEDLAVSGGTLVTTLGLAKVTYQMTGTTQTMTYTVRGDRAWIVFTTLLSTGNAEIIIDGAAPVTFSTLGANNSGKKAVYDTGTLAPTVLGDVHTITIRGASGATVFCDGLFEFNTDYGKGVQVWELGHSGFTAGDFTSALADHWLGVRDVVDPDLVVIEFGLNELNTAVPAATYKTNMRTLIQNYRAMCSFPTVSIILLAVWAPGTSADSAWAPYRQALIELAVEESVAFFDLYDLSGWMGTIGTTGVDDVVTVSGSNQITSASALFRVPDASAGVTIAQADGGTDVIPAGTTLTTRTSDTQMTMSANALASRPNGIRVKLGNRKDPEILTTDLLHPSDRGHQFVADEFCRLVAGLPRQATIPQGHADAKGDMLVAEGPDAFRKLPVGQEGQALHVAIGSQYGVLWADPGMLNRIIQVLANPTLNTFSNVGLAAAPTVTSPTAATSADQADGPFVRISTLATINSDASVVTPFNIARSAWLPEFTAAIRTDTAIDNVRIWAGLFSATPVAAADPAVIAAAFRYDTSVDGTAFWRCYSNDGTTTGLVTVTTSPIAVSSKYRLRIEFRGAVGTNATEIHFYINDQRVAIHRTELPGGAANNLGVHVGVRNLIAAQRNLLISRFGFTYV